MGSEAPKEFQKAYWPLRLKVWTDAHEDRAIRTVPKFSAFRWKKHPFPELLVCAKVSVLLAEQDSYQHPLSALALFFSQNTLKVLRAQKNIGYRRAAVLMPAPIGRAALSGPGTTRSTAAI